MNPLSTPAASRLRGAFTLIELLVVIGIIALLAAILFPVFAPLREKARQTTCQSNLRQLAIGWQMYVNDNDETSFRGLDFNYQGIEHWKYWIGEVIDNKLFGKPTPRTTPNIRPGTGYLYPYLKSEAVRGCPSRHEDDHWTAADYATTGMNESFSKPVPVALITNPTKTL